MKNPGPFVKTFRQNGTLPAGMLNRFAESAVDFWREESVGETVLTIALRDGKDG
jgi:hypothetical protein